MDTLVNINPELKQTTEALMAASDSLNIEALESIYAPEFEGVRMDKRGTIARFSKDELLALYPRLIADGHGQMPTKDTKITFAEADTDKGFVLAVRSKILATDWETISYIFYWERRDGAWRLIREFAFHDVFQELAVFSIANWLGVTEKIFDTGEFKLNYAEGAASGAPMVLLHGVTRWWQDWHKIIPRLTSDWHIYAPDLRGHGKSGRDGDHYQLEDYARDIIAFLRGQVREPVVLVGHSLGALTAILTAAQLPEWVRALVLLDPPLYLRDHPVNFVQDTANWFQLVYDLTTTVKSYDEMLEKARLFVPDGDENMIKAIAQNLYSIAPEVVSVALQHGVLGSGLEPALHKITCPTLLLQADWNTGGHLRDEDVDFVKAILPHVIVVKFPNADHQLQELHSTEVIAEMEKFLGSLEKTAELAK
ncbi:MAG: alpha/beta fold hydrolase [Chloroflexota bacterium]